MLNMLSLIQWHSRAVQLGPWKWRWIWPIEVVLITKKPWLWAKESMETSWVTVTKENVADHKRTWFDWTYHGFKLRSQSRLQLQLHCNIENCAKIYLKRSQLPLRCGSEWHGNPNIAAAIAVVGRNLKPQNLLNGVFLVTVQFYIYL